MLVCQSMSTSEGGETGGAATTTRAKPPVMPETFSGEWKFDDWQDHFKNVATINLWTDGINNYCCGWKSVWQGEHNRRLRDWVTATWENTKRPWKSSWRDSSRPANVSCMLLNFRCIERRQRTAYSAYADLQEEVRERLALNAYLEQIDDPQVAFSVKQQQPKTLDEAVSSTLEMES